MFVCVCVFFFFCLVSKSESDTGGVEGDVGQNVEKVFLLESFSIFSAMDF